MFDSLDHLLSSNARLAEAARWSLHGFHAALQAALNQHPDDPGAAECRNLLGDIDRRLDSTAPLDARRFEADPTPAPPTDEVSPVSIAEPVPLSPIESATPSISFASLWKRVSDDTDLQRRLGPFSLPEDDGEAWSAFHQLMLRTSAPIAKRWREEAEAFAASVGLTPNASADGCETLSGERDELLCPNLCGAVNASGLRLSTQAGLDARLTVRVLDTEFESLARTVSVCLQMLRLEPKLQHALKSLYPYGADPFKHATRDAYEAELMARFNRVQAQEIAGKTVAALKARLDLDEAIHSLIFSPPAERDSWWGTFQQQARNTLNQAAARVRLGGQAVELQWLWGTFANVTQRVDRSSFEMKGGATKPSEVSACLRVYARLDGEALPGRVIYRPH